MKHGQPLDAFIAEEIAADPGFAAGLEAALAETRLAFELARASAAVG